MDRATGIFNTLLSRASRIPRNFIIDQTNVYKNARKCKLKPFANYKKIAVVIVPTPEELKLRGEKQFKEMGKEVPAEAVNEMLGPRPNPQGSYHYGLVNTTRTIRLASSAPIINGKQRYAVNSASFIPADTPLKLADYFKIPGVFNLGSISDNPTGGGGYLQTSVMAAYYRTFVEVVFENPEDVVQSWHIDGHIFFVVGMDGGQWTTASRLNYNLRDGISRCTIQTAAIGGNVAPKQSFWKDYICSSTITTVAIP